MQRERDRWLEYSEQAGATAFGLRQGENWGEHLSCWYPSPGKSVVYYWVRTHAFSQYFFRGMISFLLFFLKYIVCAYIVYLFYDSFKMYTMHVDHLYPPLLLTPYEHSLTCSLPTTMSSSSLSVCLSVCLN